MNNVSLNKNIIQSVVENVCISVEHSIEICLETMKQSTEPIWYLERLKRITASIFGKVMNRKANIHPSSLINSITYKNMKYRKSVPAPLRWAIENEDIAIEKYLKVNPHYVVKKCGFVINPKWPWLGGTPDAIAVQENLLVVCVEVKCPYSIQK